MKIYDIDNPNYILWRYFKYYSLLPIKTTVGGVKYALPSWIILTLSLYLFAGQDSAIRMIFGFMTAIRILLAIGYTVSCLLIILYCLYTYGIVNERRCPKITLLVILSEAVIYMDMIRDTTKKSRRGVRKFRKKNKVMNRGGCHDEYDNNDILSS